MKLACPGCGAEMTIDVLIAHQGARDALLVALQLPAPLGKLLVQYLAMFRPPKRQLSWERVSTILDELRAPIAAAQIQRNGRTWPAPIEYWKAALEQMVQLRDQAKLQLPLKSHGYLLEVIAGMSGKAEAKVETALEKNRGARQATANPGFANNQRAEVISGDWKGWKARIYAAEPSYACLDEMVDPDGNPYAGTVSLPYSVLAAPK